MKKQKTWTVRSRFMVPALLLLIASSLIPVSFELALQPPSIFLGADPAAQDIPVGGSAIFEVTVYPQGDWKSGDVTLALVNPPQGITATLNPVKMTDVPLDGFTSNLTVKVSADAALGTITLAVRGIGTGYPSVSQGTTSLNSTALIKLNIVAATGQTTTTTTTTTTTNSSTTTGSTLTSTVTSIITTTLTTTRVSTTTIINTQTSQQPPATTELKPATNNYVVFGIGALAVSSVLFISGVLLLVSNRKHQTNELKHVR
jgi:hypothetical protein